MLLVRPLWSLYLAYQLRGQAAYPFRPLAGILADQARRVRTMVAYAYRYVPYYRETLDRLGLSPADFQSAADLAQLPILEPEWLRRDPTYFVSRAEPPERCLGMLSTGSTGEPRMVYHDVCDVLLNTAHGERQRGLVAALAGRAYRYRETVISHPDTGANQVNRFARRSALHPSWLEVRRQRLSVLDPPERVVDAIDEFRPDHLHSYGSYLAILFPYLHASGRAFHHPKVITFSSDGLGDAARRLIEREYGIPVLGAYQASEAFRIGFECLEHRGYHLNVDLYPLRIVDGAGRTLAAGKSGEVIVSNLVNRGTVLLNYRLGDIARLEAAPCPCGRSLPLLCFELGRTSDAVELPDGRVLTSLALDYPLEEAEVWQYQIVQTLPDHFRVDVVAVAGADRPALAGRIAGGLARLVSEGCTVEVRFVERLERGAAGKFRSVVPLRRRPQVAAAPTGA